MNNRLIDIGSAEKFKLKIYDNNVQEITEQVNPYYKKKGDSQYRLKFTVDSDIAYLRLEGVTPHYYWLYLYQYLDNEQAYKKYMTDLSIKAGRYAWIGINPIYKTEVRLIDSNHEILELESSLC